MKILSLLLLLSLSAFAQKQKFYLEIDDAITIANRNDAVGAYEFRLGIHHQSTKNDTDYYNFIVHVPADKTFENGSVEIQEPVFLTSDELRKLFACDVHDLLSQAKEIYLIRKNKNNLYDAWPAEYFGTVRNMVITRGRRN